MSSLSKQLENFVDTINQGPATLNPALFAGPVDRVMLGLKAHANTISHARLVALEETFPMARAEMGQATFNGLSRLYAETEIARSSDNNMIGASFTDFLATQNVDPACLDLTRIEWAWLESYHAAEAQPLQLEHLAELDETALLALPVAPHPSARLVKLHAPLSPQLSELNAAADTAAILITRPGSDVLLHPINHSSAMVFIAIDKFSNVSNLLAVAIEQDGEEKALDVILALIGAGSLIVCDQAC